MNQTGVTPSTPSTPSTFGAEDLVFNAAVLLEVVISSPPSGEGQHEWRWSIHDLYRLASAGLPKESTTTEDIR